jgi:predicted amidohydrolase
MIIGYVQFEPLLNDQKTTMATVEKLIAQGRDADLLVLPELSNSGYSFPSREHALNASETQDDSIFLELIQTACKRSNVHVVCGFNEREGDRLFNSALLVGPDGIVGKYRKMHLFLNEMDIFEPGNLGLPVFDIGICKIGILICFDWVFPEAWRILALKGADIICHPSNLVIPGLAQRAVPVQAIMNRVFTVTANRIGTEGELTFTGRSIIADPDGEVLAEASSTKEEVKLAEIDISLARDKMITERNHLFDDRRPKEYSRLVEPS